jgi:hypothetical protein
LAARPLGCQLHAARPPTSRRQAANFTPPDRWAANFTPPGRWAANFTHLEILDVFYLFRGNRPELVLANFLSQSPTRIFQIFRLQILIEQILYKLDVLYYKTQVG